MPVSIDASALVEGEAEIIRSRAIAKRVLDRFDSRPVSGTGRDDAVRPMNPSFEQSDTVVPRAGDAGDGDIIALQKGLSVQNDGKSYLLRITYTADSPERAASIANAFADAYLQSRVESAFTAAKRTSEWLSVQVEAASRFADESDEKVRSFRQDSASLLAGAGDMSAAAQQLRDAVTQLSDARLERLRLAAKLDRLQTVLSTDRMPSIADLGEAGATQQLIADEIKARAEVDQLASSLGVKHPLYIKADKALAGIHQRLMDAVSNAVANVKTDLDSAAASEKSLERRVETVKRAAASSEAAAKRLAQLEREASSAHDNLERLRESYRGAKAFADLKPVPAELVSPAEPVDVPAGPKTLIFAVLGAVGGILAAAGSVLLIEMRDTGFSTSTEFSDICPIPCLGLVPELGKHTNASNVSIREKSLKLLAVNTGLLAGDKDRTVVAVTSALPMEGKTDLIRGLAKVLALGGRRALIIEAPRQPRPALPRVTEAQRFITVESLCDDENGSSVSYYHRTTKDLSTLYDTPDRFRMWLEEHASSFDIVIVETPATLQDAQALMIAQQANFVLFAARWQSTPRATILAALAQFQPGTRMGGVLTMVDLKRHHRGGYKDSLHFYNRYNQN